MAFPTPSLITSGTTFAQLQGSGGALSGLLETLISKQVATAKPTVAVTATATGGGATGGSLAAGTYYFVSTETNAFGETTIGPESAQLTVASTNIPRFTFPSLKTGNTARNLYLGAKNGPSGGPYYLYASGITAGTYDAAAAAPANSYAVQPPTVNSTAPTFTGADGTVRNKALELIRAFERGNGQDVYRYAAQVVSEFLAGKPVAWNDEMAKLKHAYVAFLMIAQALNEVGTLMDANPGSLSNVQTPIGGRKSIRQWP